MLHMQNTEKKTPTSFLRNLRVFGFDEHEPVILASLVSGDPILLIGNAGTGKTYLLNSISEALALEHRHYNASLISFDDLVGYPYPAPDGKEISFLPTPATIWRAESVLVDELSRCKPETQNKFFSMIHEKMIQGIPLSRLVYRWAAMNPFSFKDADSEENYEGSQPLDPALADRFAFIINVPDWSDLTRQDQEAVIHPAGECVLSNDNGNLLNFVISLRPVFKRDIESPLPEVVQYARIVTTLLTESGLRISPRRARLLARNLTAVLCVAKALEMDISEKGRQHLYKLALRWSIPQRACREHIADHTIASAHAEACRLAFQVDHKQRWISEFLMADTPVNKIGMLLAPVIDRDTKSLGVIQMMGHESAERKAIFAFSAYPFLNESKMLTEEALDAILPIAMQVIEVKGKLEWREGFHANGQTHPDWAKCQQLLNSIPKSESLRRDRARNLFLHLLTSHGQVKDPAGLETQLNACFELIGRSMTKLNSNK
jgi:MoxR-like ATPase